MADLTPQEIIAANLNSQGQLGANISILMDNTMYLIEQGNMTQAISLLGFARQFGLMAVNTLPITQNRK